MLLTLTAIKLLAEIALLALLGRCVLAWWLARLAPGSASHNPFMWLLSTLSAPALRLAAFLSPRWVLPRHHPVVALALLLAIWLSATIMRINLCLEVGMDRCR